MNIKLNSEVRDIKINPSDLRKKGLIPAVLYGKGVENVNLEINQREFEKVYDKAGETTIIELIFGKEKRSVLIHYIQYNYLKGVTDHIDFYQVNMDEKISAEIELEFIGKAPAVDSFGGVLVKVLHKVEVEALPADLPHNLQVDLSKLINFETNFMVKDLIIPKGVKVLADSESVIALVAPPREEEVIEEQLEARVDNVKVEGEEKRAQKDAKKEEEKK